MNWFPGLILRLAHMGPWGPVIFIAAYVGASVILDGRVQHAVLLEIFTESGIGTLIGAEIP